MFLNILIISIVLLSLAMLGLGLNMLVKKKGKFPAYRVGHNPEMRKIGITCVKHEESRCHNKQIREEDCAGCQQLV